MPSVFPVVFNLKPLAYFSNSPFLFCLASPFLSFFSVSISVSTLCLYLISLSALPLPSFTLRLPFLFSVSNLCLCLKEL
jgi:cellulose synthase/poly-beta-1,6-N-acetylglucosamine synthase-like glycosyltransferase